MSAVTAPRRRIDARRRKQLGVIGRHLLLIVASVTSGGEETKTVALVGGPSQPYAQPLRAAGPALDATIVTTTVDDRAAAVALVRDGDADAAVVDGRGGELAVRRPAMA